MRADFRPPRDNPWIIRAAWLAARWVARLWRRVVAIEVPEKDLDRLRALRDQRLLLCSNHPTLGDPLVILELCRRLDMRFNGMAAREIFQGPAGWLFQRMGAYSVLRGSPDREAIRTTRRLLAEEDRKIVVFPEGVTYEHNDLLLPFQAGVIQMGFWALEDLEKLGKETRLPIVPVAIKYLLVGDARPVIARCLAALERALGLPEAPEEDLYGRLRAVGDRVMDRLDRELGLSPAPGTPLSERITAAKEHILTHVAQELGVRLPPGAPPAERMHILDNAMAAYVAEYARSEVDYERRLHQRRLAIAKPLAADLRRLHNFLAVSDGYVAAGTTVERFVEVLGHLELEVLGRQDRRLPSRALVRIGEPLDLGDFFPEYRQNKRAAVAAATEALQRRIQELLQPLSAMGTPLVETRAQHRDAETIRG
jgi:1-acyl-sn-glycerol-3-phosphate acyltransferase